MAALGVWLAFAGPHGRLAPAVQTVTCPFAHRNTVVSIAARAGISVPNTEFTSGTRLSGIGRNVSSVPTRAQNFAGVSARAATTDPRASAAAAVTKSRPGLVGASGGTISTLFPNRVDDPAIVTDHKGEPVRIGAHVVDPVGRSHDARMGRKIFLLHDFAGGRARRCGSPCSDTLL